jgi:ssRNA-specific RNase YbeY (16S rRNA maturation enzyme)
LEKEALLYALHGLLHCLGHDDHDEAAYQAMHALEDALLDAIGVGPVFDPDPDG